MNSFTPTNHTLTRQNGNVSPGLYAHENDYLLPYDADAYDADAYDADAYDAEKVYMGKNHNSCISAAELWDADYPTMDRPFPHFSGFYPETHNQYYHDNVRIRLYLTDDIRVDESATALSKALGDTFNRMLSATLNYKYQFIVSRYGYNSTNSVYTDWVHFNDFKMLPERKKRTPPDARDLPLPSRLCKKRKVSQSCADFQCTNDSQYSIVL